MSLRSRREFEEQLQDSPAGLAVCDALMQSNVRVAEVSSELLQEMLCDERRRRWLCGTVRLRVFRGNSSEMECG